MGKFVPEPLQWFKHPLAKHDVYFFAVNGVVVGDKIWSETSVQSSGGGGTLTYGSGQIHAPTITSTTTTNREIWIRDPSGTEHCIRGDENVRVNAGNDVSVVYCGTAQSGNPVALVNRTTNYWHSVGGPFTDTFVDRFALRSRFAIGGCGCSGTVAALLVICVASESDIKNMAPTLIYLLLGLIGAGVIGSYAKNKYDTRQRNAAAKIFHSHCESVCMSLF